MNNDKSRAPEDLLIAADLLKLRSLRLKPVDCIIRLFQVMKLLLGFIDICGRVLFTLR